MGYQSLTMNFCLFVFLFYFVFSCNRWWYRRVLLGHVSIHSKIFSPKLWICRIWSHQQKNVSIFNVALINIFHFFHFQSNTVVRCIITLCSSFVYVLIFIGVAGNTVSVIISLKQLIFEPQYKLRHLSDWFDLIWFVFIKNSCSYSLLLPDSITTWEIQVVTLSPSTGNNNSVLYKHITDIWLDLINCNLLLFTQVSVSLSHLRSEPLRGHLCLWDCLHLWKNLSSCRFHLLSTTMMTPNWR